MAICRVSFSLVGSVCCGMQQLEIDWHSCPPYVSKARIALCGRLQQSRIAAVIAEPSSAKGRFSAPITSEFIANKSTVARG